MAEERFNLGNDIGHKIGKRWSRAAGSADGDADGRKSHVRQKPADNETGGSMGKYSTYNGVGDPKGGAESSRTPVEQARLVLMPRATSVHLAIKKNLNSHWNCMLPVFIALLQARLLPEGDEVMEQARSYFGVIRAVADGMHAWMTRKCKGA